MQYDITHAEWVEMGGLFKKVTWKHGEEMQNITQQIDDLYGLIGKEDYKFQEAIRKMATASNMDEIRKVVDEYVGYA